MPSTFLSTCIPRVLTPVCFCLVCLVNLFSSSLRAPVFGDCPHLCQVRSCAATAIGLLVDGPAQRAYLGVAEVRYAACVRVLFCMARRLSADR
jgi:hypothetical protein